MSIFPRFQLLFGVVLFNLLSAPVQGKDSWPNANEASSNAVLLQSIDQKGDNFLLNFNVVNFGEKERHQVTDDDGLLTAMTLNRIMIQTGYEDIGRGVNRDEVSQRDVPDWPSVKPLMMKALDRTVINYTKSLNQLRADTKFIERFPDLVPKLTSALNSLRLNISSLKEKKTLRLSDLDSLVSGPLKNIASAIVPDGENSIVSYKDFVVIPGKNQGESKTLSFPVAGANNPVGSNFVSGATTLNPKGRSRSYDSLYLPKNTPLGRIANQPTESFSSERDSAGPSSSNDESH